jgi:hypothetical protein
MLVNTAGKNRGVPGCGSAPASPMAKADMFSNQLAKAVTLLLCLWLQNLAVGGSTVDDTVHIQFPTKPNSDETDREVCAEGFD